MVPESFQRPSLVSAIVRRRTTFSLKLRLLSEPGIGITSVPVVDGEPGGGAALPRKAVARVLVSGVHASSLRAVHYARSLGLVDTRAVFFAFDADEARIVERDWKREGVDLPLEVVEAPHRDLGDPLLRYLRAITADPGLVVSVVMPELVFSGWRRMLHNQRALYIKRLLLFEPGVVRSSVPITCRERRGEERFGRPGGLDGSAPSRRALLHGVNLVGSGGTVSVINVIPAQSISARLETVTETERGRQQRLLDEARELVVRRGVEARMIEGVWRSPAPVHLPQGWRGAGGTLSTRHETHLLGPAREA